VAVFLRKVRLCSIKVVAIHRYDTGTPSNPVEFARFWHNFPARAYIWIKPVTLGTDTLPSTMVALPYSIANLDVVISAIVRLQLEYGQCRIGRSKGAWIP
jgi:hypothetical protein